MSHKIYLVEDEQTLCGVLVDYLQAEGYEVVSFSDGNLAAKQIKDLPDLWILDIMLPGASGYDLVKMIKKHNKNTAVIFISARNQELDRVIGFEFGGDDYIPKPFHPKELVFRVRKLMERMSDSGSGSSREYISIGGYKIFKNLYTLYLDGTEISLTYNEFEILMYFIENKNAVLTRNQILEKIWGSYSTNRVVDDTIRRLRKKMKRLHIETIYGYGYKLVEK